MKNIVFLGFDGKYGLTYHFADWISALDNTIKADFEITFLTRKDEQQSGLYDKISKLKNISVQEIDTLNDLSSLDTIDRADIVHCHGFRQIAKILEIKKAKKLNFKTLVTMHAFRHGSKYRTLYTNIVSLLCLNKIDVVHFLSHTSKDEFLRYNLCYKRSNKSFVFPLGCNEEEFDNDESIESLDFYNELSGSANNIVYLAEFSKRKQHFHLLNSLKEVLIKEKAKLWLFGGEGGEKQKIAEYIDDNNLGPYVKIPGRIDRKYIPSILKRMNLALCTSSCETFGHVILEPMFAGIPVVTFNVGTANYLIRDFTNGFVIDGKSEQNSFKKAVEFILKNKEKASVMGQNNKSMARKWFTWEEVAKNTMEVYRSL